MAQLARLTTLKHLGFNNDTAVLTPVTLDAATAQGLAAMPSLSSIKFPDLRCAADVMKIFLDGSAASTVWFKRYRGFSAGALTALQANTRLRELAFTWPSTRPDVSIEPLLQQPTLARVRIGRNRYHRLPGDATLTLRQNNA